MQVGHRNTIKWKRGHRERKSTTSIRHSCISMEKTMKQWPAAPSQMDCGQRRDRPRTRLRGWPGFCFLQPYCQPGLGAELQGREEGLANSTDIAQTSAWKKNSNLAWKAKVIPKENVYAVLLWDYAASIYLQVCDFSFTICCIHSCAVKNKNHADPNPFK